jgi:hypothetical protein
MPGSVTSVFSEAEDFEAALREEDCLGLLVTGPGAFRARLTQVALHRIRLSAAEEYLPRIADASRRHDYSWARPARAHENRGTLSLDRHPNAES